MVEVKLGSGSLVIGIILGIGYIVMFISVVLQSSTHLESADSGAGGADLSSFLKIQSQLEVVKKESVVMERKLVDMASKLAQKSAETAVISQAIVPKNEVERRVSRPGVIILGMHRSGTSVVGGLVNKMGLKTGGPLIGAAFDNEKGFFERIDVVLQNDALMMRQNVHYAEHTSSYNALQGVKDALNYQDTGFFNEGKRGLKFLNDPLNYPWMLKDPRLCITLRTWLPLLNFVPSILFIFRHPYDVTLSMHNRETEHFKMGKAMRLWYIYNKRAILQSNDLCRVVGSHRKIMEKPQAEFDRIYDELNACGLNVPHRLQGADIKAFIDTKLQHGKNGKVDTSCGQDIATLIPPAEWAASEPDHLQLYRSSMRAYCGMIDGSAFHKDFNWDETINDV